MALNYTPIQPADLIWHHGQPLNRVHDDIYYSTDDGLAESSYVFIDGNQLQQRWQHTHSFTVAETGFGTGLNFLNCASHWLTQQTDGCLHYIAVEKHPLTRQDLQRCLQQWPQLMPYGEELLQHYPPLSFGFHCRSLFQGRVQLLLLFGDAQTLLPELQARIDAWFLDGFAPNKNPELWSPALIQTIAARTAPKGTIATYTAAGQVRRHLIQAGFQVKKRTGFGRKREMLTAHLETPPADHPQQPWFACPQPQPRPESVTIIGAGIAGCTTAYLLATQGIPVTVIETEQKPAQGASGNPAGIVMPRLSKDMGMPAQFYLSASLYSQQFYQQPDCQSCWHPGGVLELSGAYPYHELGLPESIVQACPSTDSSSLCGLSLPSDACFYPGAGWLQPARLCHRLLTHPAITLITQHTAVALSQHPDGWYIHDQNQHIHHASTVILCNLNPAS